MLIAAGILESPAAQEASRLGSVARLAHVSILAPFWMRFASLSRWYAQLHVAEQSVGCMMQAR